ncbi:MAG: hypothetical protein HQM08_15020 [Candidatus Riflebacteria bacterium]|nr:hypothetical protein [Candidatus Riflebacteria bacterium]
MMHSKSGMALILVLVVIGMLVISIFASTSHSQNERKLLEKIISKKKLIYQTRAALAVAENRLAAERWYGATKTRDVLDMPSSEPKSSTKIYLDDYVQTLPRNYGKPPYYRLLDHVKVFVEAKNKGDVLYGFGKYAMSPEPLFEGCSTIGVRGGITGKPKAAGLVSKDKKNGGVPPPPKPPAASITITIKNVPTLKRMISVKFMTEEDVLKYVPTFMGMQDPDSRKALGRALAAEHICFAKNYAQNKKISQNLESFSSPITLASPPAQEDCKKLIESFESAGNIFANETLENKVKNGFLCMTLESFYLSTNWDINRASKEAKAKSILFCIKDIPEKCSDSSIETAINDVFGGPPIRVVEGRDYIATISYDSGTSETAAEKYIKFRGFDKSIPDETVNEFSHQMGTIKTANLYSFSWQADYVTTGEGAGNSSTGGGILDSAEYLDLKSKVGTVVESDASHTKTLVSVNVTGKSGPNPYLSDIMVSETGTAKEFPLEIVLNFFMKYEEEFLLEFPPDEQKRTGYCSPSSGDFELDPDYGYSPQVAF